MAAKLRVQLFDLMRNEMIVEHLSRKKVLVSLFFLKFNSLYCSICMAVLKSSLDWFLYVGKKTKIEHVDTNRRMFPFTKVSRKSYVVTHLTLSSFGPVI